MVEYEEYKEEKRERKEEKLKRVQEIYDMFTFKEEDFFEIISILKSNSRFSDLGDYFLTLTEMVRFDKASLENPMKSVQICYEMMKLFSKIGNKYAQNFLNCFD